MDAIATFHDARTGKVSTYVSGPMDRCLRMVMDYVANANWPAERAPHDAILIGDGETPDLVSVTFNGARVGQAVIADRRESPTRYSLVGVAN